MRRLSILPVILAGTLLLAPSRPPDALKTVEEMTSRYEKLSSYTALLVKQERDGDTLAPEEEIEIVFQKPMRIHMRWVGEQHRGQEIVFLGDEGKGKIRGHRGGLLSFFSFAMDPTDPHALAGNHHPITDAGIGKLIETIRKSFVDAAERQEVAFTSTFEDWNGQQCIRIQADFLVTPAPNPIVRTVLFIDRNLMLPVACEIYDQPDVLYERYEYRNLELDVSIPPSRFGL